MLRHSGPGLLFFQTEYRTERNLFSEKTEPNWVDLYFIFTPEFKLILNNFNQSFASQSFDFRRHEIYNLQFSEVFVHLHAVLFSIIMLAARCISLSIITVVIELNILFYRVYTHARPTSIDRRFLLCNITRHCSFNLQVHRHVYVCRYV